MAGKEVAAVAIKHAGLYRLKLHGEQALAVGHSHTKNCKHTWHRRFGHRDEAILQQIVKRELAIGIEVQDCGICEICKHCLVGKQSRKPFPNSTEKKTSAVLDLIHTDVCGPMETKWIQIFYHFDRRS